MIQISKRTVSRRRLLKAGGATALVAGVAPGVIVPGRAKAQQKTLKILQWKHFVPSYDRWFDSFAKEWGGANDTQVVVDHVGFGDIISLAKAEVEAQWGHDLVSFITPPGMYEDQAIDHREIYEECVHRYGKVADFTVKSTYNPHTKKHFGFCGTYQPALITYRKDLWDAVGMAPDNWEQVWRGGRLIKLLYEKPVGVSLASEHNSNQTMRAIMYSFGSTEQDAEGNPTLRSKATLEVIKYVKALYEEAMVGEVLTWEGSSNNLFMLDGRGCLTLDTISIARASDTMRLPIANNLRLAQVPEGPGGRLGPSFSFHTYVIWNFAQNIEGAKQFLADYVASLRQAFLASGFQNMPSFPDMVPDLATVVANDAAASPSEKYNVLADVATWTTNIGHPGYTNPAISEVYDTGLIPTMFAKAATGQLTPEQALDQADHEVRRIFQNWKDSGKL